MRRTDAKEATQPDEVGWRVTLRRVVRAVTAHRKTPKNKPDVAQGRPALKTLGQGASTSVPPEISAEETVRPLEIRTVDESNDARRVESSTRPIDIPAGAHQSVEVMVGSPRQVPAAPIDQLLASNVRTVETLFDQASKAADTQGTNEVDKVQTEKAKEDVVSENIAQSLSIPIEIQNIPQITEVYTAALTNATEQIVNLDQTTIQEIDNKIQMESTKLPASMTIPTENENDQKSSEEHKVVDENAKPFRGCSTVIIENVEPSAPNEDVLSSSIERTSKTKINIEQKINLEPKAADVTNAEPPQLDEFVSSLTIPPEESVDSTSLTDVTNLDNTEVDEDQKELQELADSMTISNKTELEKSLTGSATIEPIANEENVEEKFRVGSNAPEVIANMDLEQLNELNVQDVIEVKNAPLTDATNVNLDQITTKGIDNEKPNEYENAPKITDLQNAISSDNKMDDEDYPFQAKKLLEEYDATVDYKEKPKDHDLSFSSALEENLNYALESPLIAPTSKVNEEKSLAEPGLQKTQKEQTLVTSNIPFDAQEILEDLEAVQEAVNEHIKAFEGLRTSFASSARKQKALNSEVLSSSKDTVSEGQEASSLGALRQTSSHKLEVLSPLESTQDVNEHKNTKKDLKVPLGTLGEPQNVFHRLSSSLTSFIRQKTLKKPDDQQADSEDSSMWSASLHTSTVINEEMSKNLSSEELKVPSNSERNIENEPEELGTSSKTEVHQVSIDQNSDNIIKELDASLVSGIGQNNSYDVKNQLNASLTSPISKRDITLANEKLLEEFNASMDQILGELDSMVSGEIPSGFNSVEVNQLTAMTVGHHILEPRNLVNSDFNTDAILPSAPRMMEIEEDSTKDETSAQEDLNATHKPISLGSEATVREINFDNDSQNVFDDVRPASTNPPTIVEGLPSWNPNIDHLRSDATYTSKIVPTGSSAESLFGSPTLLKDEKPDKPMYFGPNHVDLGIDNTTPDT